MLILVIVGVIAILALGFSQFSFAGAGGSGGGGTGNPCCNPPCASLPTPVLSGKVFTYSELVTLAENAGFSGNDALTAAGIAMAESSGNPNAYNPETAANAPEGYGSYGLWQIYLNVHPEFAGQNLYDPNINASAAYSVWKEAGNSFDPWSTFKNNAYAKYVQPLPGLSA